ncbi:MAG: hypothetical protein K8I03_06905 [Ignavibacteria bacterium]|nr:hypothetical protein [Ignavibacteria bacterium]
MKTLKTIFALILFLIAADSFSQSCTQPNSLVSISNTRIFNYEYVTFVFKNPSSFTYSTSAVTGPFENATSGEPVSINGCSYRKITFTNAYWMCESTRMFYFSAGRKIKDIETTEQFEGTISYVVGFDCSANYVTTYSYNMFGMKYVVMKFQR